MNGYYDQNGIYHSVAELISTNKANLITESNHKKGIFKEYEDGTCVIFWASPLADLYYNNEDTKMTINEYCYKKMLIRTFSFNPLKYINEYIMNKPLYKKGAISPFLMNILTEKSQSDELTDIIYSIQSNQNKIIRTDSSKNFVVQGCAGSGKTMILLHRLAYLKYNDELPDYSQIKIITPNSIFKDFISNLSNKLDIKEINQITISNYYDSLNIKYLNRYYDLKNVLATEEDELPNNKYLSRKYLLEYAQKKKDEYKNRFSNQKMIDENESLTDVIEALYSKNLLSFIKDSYNKIVKKELKSIKELNFYEIDLDGLPSTGFARFLYKSTGIIKSKSKAIDNIEDDKRIYERNLKDLEEELKNNKKNANNSEDTFSNLNEKNKKYISTIFSKRMVNLNSEINDLNDKIEDLKAKISERKKLKSIKENEINKLIETRKNILEKLYFSIDLYDVIIKDIEKKYDFKFTDGKFTRIQLLILLYINFLHYGPLINNDKLLCIDEAQDYNIIEYQILKLVNDKVVMNLYGDINQSFFLKGLNSWKELEKEFQKFTLNENYRNSKQITNFCNSTFGYNCKALGINSIDVKFIMLEETEDIVNRKIKEKRKVAIIAKDEELIQALDSLYNNEYIICTNVPNAKGIEYDTVIVIEEDMGKNEKYISCTRALNELYIIKKP